MVTSFTSITDVVAYAVTVEVPLVRRELIPAAGDRADPVFTARGAWTLESIGGVLARILQSCAEAAATGKHELIARRTPDAGRRTPRIRTDRRKGAGAASHPQRVRCALGAAGIQYASAPARAADASVSRSSARAPSFATATVGSIPLSSLHHHSTAAPPRWRPGQRPQAGAGAV